MSSVLSHMQMVGASHRNAPLPILEKLSLRPEDVVSLYERLPSVGIQDALILSTCNRTEIYGTHPDADRFAQACRELLEQAAEAHWPGDEHFTEKRGVESVKHLFRVVCGLDSMVVGETQILGQLKSAYEARRSQLGVKLPLEPIFERALVLGKRCRTETEIGRGVVSVASAAVHLASRIHSDLSEKDVVVVGAGETGRLLAEHFAKLSPKSLTVVNRTASKAEALASQCGGRGVGLDTLGEALEAADVAAFAATVSEPLFAEELAERVLASRRGRSLAILDLGLPRNVAAELNDWANVFLHDLESIRHVVDSSLKKRRKEIPRVESLILEEIDNLVTSSQERGVGPLIGALRESVESLRQAEVEKFSKGLSQQEKEAVEAATRAVVNKLLHGPVRTIKEFARQDDDEKIKVLRSAFGADESSED